MCGAGYWVVFIQTAGCCRLATVRLSCSPPPPAPLIAFWLLAAAVATGTATWAIAAIYADLYGRDLVNWAKRSGAKQLRRSEVSADSERQCLLGPEQKGYQ